MFSSCVIISTFYIAILFFLLFVFLCFFMLKSIICTIKCIEEKTYKRKCCRLGSNLSALYFEYPFKFLSYYYGYSYFLGRKVIKRIICKKKAFKRLQKFWIYVKKWWKDCLSLFLYSPNIHKWEFSYIIKWEIHVWNFIKLSQIMYLVIKYLACYILPYIFLWYQFKAK